MLLLTSLAHQTPEQSDGHQVDATGGKSERRWRTSVVLLAVIVMLVFAFVVYSVVAGPPSGASFTSTYYSTSPDAVVLAAAQPSPAGYSLESRSSPTSGAAQNGDWAVLGQADGSAANLTVIVFSSTNASQSYFSLTKASLDGLPGYTDVTSTLSAYLQYGKCYAVGEDVDGIAVINGFCTKGNVLLQVHLVSGKAFSGLEADLTSLMGSLYQSTG
jgi:hypothetical protein